LTKNSYKSIGPIETNNSIERSIMHYWTFCIFVHII